MEIEKLDYYGRGITHIDNKICFVKNALEKEVVDINIISENKRYLEATTTSIKNKNINRVTPKCKYYSICGGCHLMHMNEDFQEQFKINKVKEILKYKSSIDIEINNIYYNNFYNYRNKIVLHVNDKKIGFYKEKTNELIEIRKCLIVNKRINRFIKYLEAFIKEEKDIKSITIKVGNKTNEIMLIVDGKVNNYFGLLELVDVLIINNKVLSEKNYIKSIIGSKKYIISKESFFQVNKYVTKKLYDDVLDIIKENSSKNVLDLYCGTGTIGIYIADIVDKVIGIEVVEDAIKDAYVNKKINKVSNISFICGKVEDEINSIDEDIDTIIVDPPRKGLSSRVIEVIKRINPKLIIYVSCNPLTLAKNINELNDIYSVENVMLYDMFPNTYHVESVSVLERRNVEK